jgi:hypothetical protein
VARLYATDYAEIRLPLADKQLAFLDLPGIHSGGANAATGPRVVLHARFAGAERTWIGRVVRTEGEIDAQSRMVHVVARVADPYGVAVDREPARAAVPSGGGDREGDGRESADSAPSSPKRAPLPDALEQAATAEGAAFPLAVGLFVKAEIEGRVAHDVLTVPRAAMRDGDRLLVVDRDSRLRERESEVLRIDRDEVLVRADIEPGDRVVVSPLQVVVDGMRVRTEPVELAGRS